jgi:hypothetical protein
VSSMLSLILNLVKSQPFFHCRNRVKRVHNNLEYRVVTTSIPIARIAEYLANLINPYTHEEVFLCIDDCYGCSLQITF